MGKIIAVIDLGSNSLRMSINSLLEDGSFKLLKKVRETVRLSETITGSYQFKLLTHRKETTNLDVHVYEY